MTMRDAARAFAALSQEIRIQLVRHLSSAGAEGSSAGELAAALGLPASTLSFHLASLEQAGLIEGRRRGRQMIYAPRPAGLRALLAFAAQACLTDGHAIGEQIAQLPAEAFGAPPPAAIRDVLFLCHHNSARSILAEAILRQVGAGRFRAYSAGPHPASRPLPQVVDLLATLGHDVACLRSKSWDEFAEARGGPPVDFVLTLCDLPDDMAAPPFAGDAVRAAWPLPDPARFDGTAVERRALLNELYGSIRRRLLAFCQLPFATLDRMAIRSRLAAIGEARPDAAWTSIA